MSHNSNLLLFTIGPVQSFISQARKTRDLYAGSQLLSQLIRRAMEVFQTTFSDGEIIFPDFKPSAQSEMVSYPNRFVAKVVADSSELKEKGAQIEDAVQKEWEKIASKALDGARVQMSAYWREQYFAQIRDFLQIHWLFVPMHGEEYDKAYRTLERMGGAIKNIRPFKQLVERGVKCSLDGQYNAIFFSPDNKRTSQGVRVPQRFLIGSTEGLSAVSFVKRWQKIDLPSTSTVALMEDTRDLDDKSKRILDCFKKLFEEEKVVSVCVDLFNAGLIEKAKLVNPKEENNWCTDYDSHFLFEENLTGENIKNEDQLKLLRDLQQQLKEKLKTRYYAMLMFDGDQMGKWLSGELLNAHGKANLEDFHRALSEALADFAAWARGFLNENNHNGQTIYAGGDDFLGFVNVHHLFEVLRTLRKHFHEIVNGRLSDYLGEKQLTFSAGVVVAHYKMPFSEVLRQVRALEKKAKKEGGRNAFAIAVMKHSGEIQETVYKWDADPDSASGTSNLDALEYVYKQIDSKQKNGNFSNTFIQVLTQEMQDLFGYEFSNPGAEMISEEKGDLEEPIVMGEISRLVKRSCLSSLTKEEKERVVPILETRVRHLYQNRSSESKVGSRHFVHALHIADFLNRKTTEQS